MSRPHPTNRAERRSRATRSRPVRGLVASLAVAAGVVGAAVPVAAGPPQTTITDGPNAGRAMGTWGGYVNGEYIGVGGSLGGGLIPGVPGVDLQLSLGEFHADARSAGLGSDLDLLAWDETVDNPQPEEYARGRVTHFEVGALDNDIDPTLYTAEQRSLPQKDDWEITPGVPAGTGIPGVLTTGIWSGRARASWEADTPSAWGRLRPGEDSVQAQSNSQMGQVSLLNLTELLPIPGITGALIGATGGDQTSTVGTVAKPDGSLAAYAEIDPTFVGVDLLGGATGGGLSIGAAGTIGQDGEWEEAPIAPGASTRIRAVADGTPGGADIDGGEFGTEPQLPAFEVLVNKDLIGGMLPGAGVDASNCATLATRPDICRVAVQPGVSLNVAVPSQANPILSGTLTFVTIDDNGERIDAAGRYAEVKAGGITAELTVSTANPNPLLPRINIGTIRGGIATPTAGVQVPAGGIYAVTEVDPIPVAPVWMIGAAGAGAVGAVVLRRTRRRPTATA